MGNVQVRPDTKILDFCTDHLSEQSSVLDVGAGFGAHLFSSKERGHTVRGIERSKHRARYLREHLGIPCTHTSLESATIEEHFGLILSHHVLEHVSDPAAVIQRMVQLLSNKGMLYIAVPNFWQEYPPLAIHFVPHLSWFTVKSLSRLLGKNGLQVVKKAVGIEIQLLAIKEAAPTTVYQDASDESSRSRFWSRTSAYMLDAFGSHEGRHILVWSKANEGETYWRRRVYSNSQLVLWLIRMAFLVRRTLPKRVWRRVLPGLLAHTR